MLKLVGLFSLATGALLHAVHGPVRVHEVQLFRQLWGHLTQSDVLLADRGFCSFGFLAALQQRGIDSLLRLHQTRPVDFRHGKRLGKADRLLEWAKPRRCPRTLSAEQFAALPDRLTVRQLRVKPTLKGFRPRSLVLVDHPAGSGRLSGRGPGRTLSATLASGIAFPGTRKPCCGSTCYAAVRRR